MEPIAVLHLADCLNPGGTERQLIEQVKRADRARWRPLVGTFHAGGSLRGELDALSVPVSEHPLHTSLAHPNTVKQILAIAALCRRERVKILHAHDFYANLIGLAAAKLGGARLVTSRRDLAHWLSPSKRRALGFACRQSDRVVANAEAVAAATVEELRVPRARVRVVPNGIDLARFDAQRALPPDPAIDPPLDEGELPIVAVVSNLNLPDKGHADLLAAAALLAGEGARFRLVLVGEGAERPKLEAMARELGLDARFLGRRFDVPRLLPRFDVVCLPSWAEGFPNALVEAMAAQRPVVATAVGGCPELIDEGVNGHLVPPRAPADLAAAIGKLLADPDRARAMGRRGRAVVEKRHDLDHAARVLDGIYSEILS